MDKRTVGGSLFSSEILYRILKNQQYRGKIKFKDKVYAGSHEALIDEATFSDVQIMLISELKSRDNKMF